LSLVGAVIILQSDRRYRSHNFGGFVSTTSSPLRGYSTRNTVHNKSRRDELFIVKGFIVLIELSWSCHYSIVRSPLRGSHNFRAFVSTNSSPLCGYSTRNTVHNKSRRDDLFVAQAYIILNELHRSGLQSWRTCTTSPGINTCSYLNFLLPARSCNLKHALLLIRMIYIIYELYIQNL
jgi:hypothetical protein